MTELFITFTPSPDDPDLHSAEYQQTLQRVENGLNAGGGKVSSRFELRESEEGSSTFLGTFIMKTAPVWTTVRTVVEKFLEERAGRKVTLQVGNVKAEAQTVEQVEKLFEIVKKYEDFHQREQG